MTADQKNARMMMGGMVLIIGLSTIMHVFLVRKKAIESYRYQPQYGDKVAEKPEEKFLKGSGTRTGEVIAISYDKFFMRLDGQVQPFANGNLVMPDVGKTITVSYTGGDPPQAVSIKLEEDPPATPSSRP